MFHSLDLDVTLTKQMEFTTFTCSGYLVKLGGNYTLKYATEIWKPTKLSQNNIYLSSSTLY